MVNVISVRQLKNKKTGEEEEHPTNNNIGYIHINIYPVP